MQTIAITMVFHAPFLTSIAKSRKEKSYLSKNTG